MYLTYSEFKSILSDSVDEVTFDKLLVRAEIQIDTVTNYFYSMPGINDIESDSISKYPWLKARSDVFKKALALTIDYMNSNNVSNSADLKIIHSQVSKLVEQHYNRQTRIYQIHLVV